MSLESWPTCTLDGCEEDLYALGFCQVHYSRQYRTGSPRPETPIRRYCSDSCGCSTSGCERRHYARGLCKSHYERNRLGESRLPAEGVARAS